jgi:plastocyanin
VIWRAVVTSLQVLTLAAASAHRPLPPAAVRRTVAISSLAYHPADLEVAPGDTIIWVNRDIVPHTATSDKSPRAIDTGTMAAGDSSKYIATRAGVYRYTCAFHPTMQGRLVVRAVATPGAQKQS